MTTTTETPTTEVVDMTPAMARHFLTNFNTKNRQLRNHKVEALLATFRRGEYVFTHQGIAFDAEGEIIDGQHRLSAMCSMPEDSVFPILVTRGLDRLTVFGRTDIVEPRRLYDLLNVPRRRGECVSFLTKLYLGHGGTVSGPFAQPFDAKLGPLFDDLISFCGKTAKTWSAAPVCAAAVVSMLAGGDVDYIKLIYNAMVRAEFDTMPKIVQALYRSHLQGHVRAGAGYDMFVRCLKVYDRRNADLSKVQITDQAAVVSSVRDLLAVEVLGKKAGDKRADFTRL